MMDKQADLNNSWKKFKNDNDNDARQDLIEAYLPLVQYIAGRMAIHLPEMIEYQDLLSYGVFGLMDAIDKFELERNIKFETYANTRIRGGIIDGLRSTDWIPRSVRAKAKQIDQEVSNLENNLGRRPSESEVAASLDMSLDKYQEVIHEIQKIPLLSLDAPEIIEQGSNPIKLLDSIGDQTAIIDQDLIKSEVKQELAKAIDSLNKNERIVISLYYYEGLTLREIGHVIEVSESRVSQIHSKAIKTLQKKLNFY